MPIRRILVPLDGSAFAEQALPVARLIARRAAGRLVLAHARTVLWPLGEPDLLGVAMTVNEPELRRAAQDYLDDLAARVAGRGDASDVATVLLDGDAADALRDAVAAQQADIVVMASHGRGGLSRILLGSTTESLVARTHAPVLAVRRTDPQAEVHAGTPAPFDPVRDESETPRHVLVALDGSPTAEAVIPAATELARLFDAVLTLVAVRDTRGAHAATLLPTAVLDPAAADPRAVAGPDEPVPDAAAAYLASVARRIGGVVGRVDTRVVEHRDVAEGIVACASDVGADLIALATHGHGAWARLMYGGVATGVMQRVLLPVLLVHAEAPGPSGLA